MVQNLDAWANGRRPTPEQEAEEELRIEALGRPLKAMSRAIEVQRFMGRWYVIANIPTYPERGMMNCIEDYTWDAKKNVIQVQFQMQSSPTAALTKLDQRATVKNDLGTRWAIRPRVIGAYLPLDIAYLIVSCAEDYSCTIIGVPDRSYLWIMARSPDVEDAVVQSLIAEAVALGYDSEKILTVTHDYTKKGAAAEDNGAAAEETS